MTQDIPPMNSIPELLLRENRVADLDLGTIYHALLDARGNLRAAAEALEVSRTKLRDKIMAVPALVQLLNDFREGTVDKAEANIFAEVEKGDPSSSRFILTTLGKDRGYVQGVSGSAKDGGIEVTIRTFAPQEADNGQKDAAANS